MTEGYRSLRIGRAYGYLRNSLCGERRVINAHLFKNLKKIIADIDFFVLEFYN